MTAPSSTEEHVARIAKDGYTIRLARNDEVARLPDVERRAASAFSGREAELGLSAEHLLSVSTVEALTRANLDGRLWVAVDAEGAPVGFALVIELGLFAHLHELDLTGEPLRLVSPD